MSKRKIDRLFDQICEMTKALSEDDEALTGDEVRSQLRQTGIDPDDLTVRFHEKVKQLAQRERMANRSISQSLKRAVDSTQSKGQLASDPTKSTDSADHWLEKFTSAFALPPTLEGARAYRALDDISAPDQKGLDELEAELKERVKKENDRQT